MQLRRKIRFQLWHLLGAALLFATVRLLFVPIVKPNSPVNSVAGNSDAASFSIDNDVAPAAGLPALSEQIPSQVVSAITHHKKDLLHAGADPISSLMAILLDPSQTLKLRRQAAWQLAKVDSAEALAALRQALPGASPQLRATIAEALGGSGHPGAKALLESLVGNEDERVIRGAIRGLADVGDEGSVKLLAGVLRDGHRSGDVRVEAALALGEIHTPAAYAALRSAITTEDQDIARAVLSGLGRRPFDETEGFFRSYLESENLDGEMRGAALEALADASGNPAPFLSGFLQDQEPEVRAAAAWAIANLESPGDVSGQLAAQLLKEPESEVRTRLYQALENQQNVDVASLFGTVLADSDMTSQLAGFKLLAGQLQAEADPSLRIQFDEVVVPKLRDLALTGTDLHVQLNSIIALRAAKTQEAISALQSIAAQSQDWRVVQAARTRPEH
jgi:HEAT repeat protein